MTLPVDLHEHLVEVPSAPAGLHALDPPLSDFSSEHWSEPMPSEPDSFVADIDDTSMQQVLDVPKG